MKHLKQLIAILLVIGMVISYMPKISIAQDDQSKTEAKVTTHQPGSSMTKGKDLPPKKGGGKWLWGVLGGAAIIGIIAAVAGGGSSGGGGNGDDDTYGDLTGTW
jgi:hypothetical protein